MKAAVFPWEISGPRRKKERESGREGPTRSQVFYYKSLRQQLGPFLAKSCLLLGSVYIVPTQRECIQHTVKELYLHSVTYLAWYLDCITILAVVPVFPVLDYSVLLDRVADRGTNPLPFPASRSPTREVLKEQGHTLRTAHGIYLPNSKKLKVLGILSLLKIPTTKFSTLWLFTEEGKIITERHFKIEGVIFYFKMSSPRYAWTF